MMPIHGSDTVVSDLVYSVSSGNVDTTIVDGSVLMQDREIKTVNLDEVLPRTQELALRMVSN